MLPLFWIAACFAAGIFIGSLFPISAWIWGVVSIAFFLGAVFFRKDIQRLSFLSQTSAFFHVSPFVLIFFFFLGAFRYSLSLPHWTQNDLAWYNGRGSETLVVVIDQTPDRRESAVYYHVQARELYDAQSGTYLRISGQALVRMDANASWQLGDELRFTASPATPNETEDFSYRRYLERQGVYTVIYHPTSVARLDTGQVSLFKQLLEGIRQRASATIYAIFPQPESGLLEGILLGNDNNLPQEVQQAYQDTGTAHIIAISGFNMTVLAVVCIFLFGRFFSTRASYLFTFIFLTVYALFVGGSPSVIRALIMVIAAYSGKLIGRKGSGLNTLGLAAGGMLAINPLLLSDASFQLSFAATIGLILFGSKFTEALWPGLEEGEKYDSEIMKASNPLTENFFTSLSAQIITLPVIALQFNRLSLTSLLANPLVLPVQQVILVGGMAATIAGMFWKGLGKILAMLVWPLLAYSNRMVETIAQIPNSAIPLNDFTASALSVFAIFLITGGIMFFYRKKWWKKIKPVYLMLILAVAAFLLWTSALRRPDGNLHISILQADDGTALSLVTPGGSTLLIDPTGSVNTLSSKLSQSMLPWDSHLDLALFTHSSSLNQLTSLNDRLPVKTALLSAAFYHVDAAESTVSLPEGVQIKELKDGEILRMDGSVEIQVLASDNSHSALLVRYGSFRALIPGGLDPADFKTASAQKLQGLSVLLLNDDDLSNLPADMWQQNFPAKAILWNSTNLAPVNAWSGPDISITSDGSKFW